MNQQIAATRKAPSWMGSDVIAFIRTSERICYERRATIVTQCDLVHVDGTLLYRGVKPGEEKGLGVQIEVGAMAWAIKCNAAMVTA
jgi:hypothetical protein